VRASGLKLFFQRERGAISPDVKLRGTASNIAEKYRQLAREAHTSGDLVAAEAYHQYAEHYYRLIAEQDRSRVQ
jgi:Domain of unknown function (DUF4167)